MIEQVYKIDPEGRYVIVAKYPEDVYDIRGVENFREILYDWWDSNDTFLLVAVSDDVEIKFERIDKW